VRIHISGCPNNCAQTAIADIGLRGGLTKVDGQSIESYDLVVGGRTGAGRRFAETVARKIPASEVVTVIANLYRAFLAWSKNGETFSAFVDAMGTEQLAALAQSSPESRV
jgi:ferredoxin-nitrite reductase